MPLSVPRWARLRKNGGELPKYVPQMLSVASTPESVQDVTWYGPGEIPVKMGIAAARTTAGAGGDEFFPLHPATPTTADRRKRTPTGRFTFMQAFTDRWVHLRFNRGVVASRNLRVGGTQRVYAALRDRHARSYTAPP